MHASLPRRVRRARPRGALARLLRDRRGAATLENVLWTPLFVGLVALSADAGLAFHAHSRMWDVARDVARRVAVGELDALQAETYAAGALPGGGLYTIVVGERPGPFQGTDVEVVITLRDAGPIGAIDYVDTDGLEARVRMRKEG